MKNTHAYFAWKHWNSLLTYLNLGSLFCIFPLFENHNNFLKQRKIPKKCNYLKSLWPTVISNHNSFIVTLCKGICPSLSQSLGSAPYLMNRFTTDIWPEYAALCTNDTYPDLFWALTSAPCSSSSLLLLQLTDLSMATAAGIMLWRRKKDTGK